MNKTYYSANDAKNLISDSIRPDQTSSNLCAGGENGQGIWLGIWSGRGAEPEQRLEEQTGLKGRGGSGEIFNVAT